jgi:hypothetical protein
MCHWLVARESIMITIKRSQFSKNSVIFEFDGEGAKKFLCVINNCKECDDVKVDALLKKNDDLVPIALKVIRSTDEYLILGNEGNVLSIDEESIAQGVFLLEGFIKSGYFAIAEFCEINSGSGKKALTQIYFYAVK